MVTSTFPLEYGGHAAYMQTHPYYDGILASQP